MRGMRITVYGVLEHLAFGMTKQQTLDGFPYLTEGDIQACLQHAAYREHQQMVEFLRSFDEFSRPADSTDDIPGDS